MKSSNWNYFWMNLIFLLIGYLIGSLNISIFISKKRGDDIRNKGSGNAGTTNALRNYGPRFALFVFIFDFMKSYIPTMILFFIKFFVRDSYFNFVFPLIIGFGVLIGHIFPIYFKFKGGKGVATFFGITLAFNVLLFITFVSVYISFILMTKIVSISSVVSSSMVSLLSLLPLFYSGIFSFMQQNTIIPIHGIIMVFSAILIMFMHIPNYKKIAYGNENKLKFLL